MADQTQGNAPEMGAQERLTNPAAGGSPGAPTLPPGQRIWYAGVSGQRVGPFDLDEMLRKLSAGQVATGDMAWRPGMAQWARIQDIPEIMRLYQGGGGSPDVLIQGGRAAYERGREATRTSFQTLKRFFLSPAEGLAPALHSLPAASIASVGAVFVVCYLLCFGVVAVMSDAHKVLGFEMWVKSAVVALMPIAGLMAAFVVYRALFHLPQHLSSDLFVAAATLLYAGMFVLISTIIERLFAKGSTPYVVLIGLAVFTLCYMILTILTGLTKILRLPEKSVGYLLPISILASGGLTYLVVRSMLQSMMAAFVMGQME